MDNTDYRNIILQSSFGYAYHSLIVDAEGNPADYVILEVNKAFENLTGISSGVITGKSILEVSRNVRYDAPYWISFYGEVMRKNECREFEYYSENLDRWFRVQVTPRENNRFITLFFDITDLKKTQKELELYFRAMQSIDQPVLITDRNGNIIRINNAFIKMYGFTIDELTGKNPRILNPGRNIYLDFGYTEEEHDRLFSSMWKSISDTESGTWENVVINRKKDGTLIWVRLFINAVYGDDGMPENFIALPVDITSTIQNEAMTKVELYRTIAALAELRDNETGNHMRRVGLFAKLIARQCGMPEKYCNDIEIFAPLHDIGKVGIIDSILLAERELTEEELAVMKSHAVLGYNIVKGKKELEMIAAITIAHHEQYDGSGYPYGLSGENIPLSARITAVADVYDALRSRRPYKKAWDHESAVRYILENAGRQFDPAIAEHFRLINERFSNIYAELGD